MSFLCDNYTLLLALVKGEIMGVYYTGHLAMQGDRSMDELTAHVQRLMREEDWSYREAAGVLGVSKRVIEAIAKDQFNPELDTLRKLAKALKLPLWRVVQMSGVDLDLPKSSGERTRRLTALAETMPQYQAIVDHLLALNPDDADGILMHLEGIARRRAQGEDVA